MCTSAWADDLGRYKRSSRNSFKFPTWVSALDEGDEPTALDRLSLSLSGTGRPCAVTTFVFTQQPAHLLPAFDSL